MRGDPDRSGPVLEEADDAPGRSRLAREGGLEPSRRHALRAGGGPDPDGAVPGFEEAAHVLRREAALSNERGRASTAHAEGAGRVGAHQQGPVGGFRQAGDLVRPEAVTGAEDRHDPVLDPVEAAAGGCDPQGAVAGLEDGPRVVAREAFRHPEREEFPVGEAIEAADPRPDPDVPFTVRAEAPDLVVREPVLRGEEVDPPVANPGDSASPGPDPQRPVPIHVKGGDLLGRKASDPRHLDAAGVLHRQEPAPRSSHPDTAVGVGRDRADDVAREPFRGVDDGDRPVPHPENALPAGADPEIPGTVAADRAQVVAREAVRRRERRLLLAPEPQEAGTARRDPDVAVRGLAHRPGRDSLCEPGVEVRDDSGFETGDSSGQADPEPAPGVLEERRDGAAPQLGIRPFVPDAEAHAVEPREALLGADPEVSVAGLEQGLDRVLGKALLRLPRVEAVLRQGLGGVEGDGGRGAEHPRGGEDAGESPHGGSHCITPAPWPGPRSREIAPPAILGFRGRDSGRSS